MSIDGLIYLLNQSGIALAQAHAEIERLQAALADAQRREPDEPGQSAS